MSYRASEAKIEDQRAFSVPRTLKIPRSVRRGRCWGFGVGGLDYRGRLCWPTGSYWRKHYGYRTGDIIVSSDISISLLICLKMGIGKEDCCSSLLVQLALTML